MNGRLCRPVVVGFLALIALLPRGAGADDEARRMATEILQTSGVRGGMVICLGTTSVELPLALRANTSYVVQVLARDDAQVQALRQQAQDQHLAGSVTATLLHGQRLPYVDNLVNLVVVAQDTTVPRAELLRVLAPQGVLCQREADRWVCTSKPRSDAIDQWSHFLHDAGNNAVADDQLVGPPRQLQWCAAPLWLRSHETPSGIQAPVAAGGRLFYIFDEGLIGITDERLEDRWALLCRDAFNGKLLWRRPLGDWGWRQWNRAKYEGQDWLTLRAVRTDVPLENQRRVVASEDRLLVTLAHQAPMSILDAATGELIRTVPETDFAREILLSDGIALAYCQEGSANAARRRGQEGSVQARLVAVDAATGQVLWQTDCQPILPTLLAIQGGHIICGTGKELVTWDLHGGQLQWRATLRRANPRTLVAVDGVAIAYGARDLAAYDLQDGSLLWQQDVTPIQGAENVDLFVIDGVVWRGLEMVDDAAQPAKGKTAHALARGWNLRTGQEVNAIFAQNLRSPEHHHRCYRNKATSRYIITSMEGAEFLDLADHEHSQENWLRGSCRSGMMPCNGMLYVPPDQCFCEPGAKLLGFTALAPAPRDTQAEVSDHKRLERGPAFGSGDAQATLGADAWPTLRHDAARRGSTSSAVPANVQSSWQTQLAAPLTAPVAAHDLVLVAEKDCHRLVALRADTGRQCWDFLAGGRIDSPPTMAGNLVLFGSCDGYVYCLRAEDGQLVWRFLAAPRDQRIAHFEQLESTWPVHGSVLVERGVVYFAAGRSTYLDGGVYLYGLDPATGQILHRNVLSGPFPALPDQRDKSFYVLGANADVLVAEGGFIYMRQKKLTYSLQEVAVEVLSSKGEQNVGLHLFSTSGLLDGSWYNRTFWMYSKRWPGFQLANQAPKAGQLLVVDDQRTYALRVFYRRNVHSPMFFPEREGYLLFADHNSAEPQIVGEAGAQTPVPWLPQSDYSRGRGDEVRRLDSEAFGLDKMIGYTRAEPPVWTQWLPVRVRGMVKAGSLLFVAGDPDVLDPADQTAAFEGRRGAKLVVVSTADGRVQRELALDAPPVFDGLIAASGRLYMSTTSGQVVCLGAESRP